MNKAIFIGLGYLILVTILLWLLIIPSIINYTEGKTGFDNVIFNIFVAGAMVYLVWHRDYLKQLLKGKE